MQLDKLQLEGIEFLKTHNQALINIHIGGGKTILAITYLQQVNLTAVVLTPKSIIAYWKQHLITDDLRQRVTVISQSQIDKNLQLIGSAGIVIIDEPQRLKNNSKFFRTLMNLECCENQKRFLLDATIIETGLQQLDNICAWLRIEDRNDLPLFVYPKDRTNDIAPREKKTSRIIIPIPAHRRPVVKFWELELAKTLIPRISSMRAVQMAIYEIMKELNDTAINCTGYQKALAIRQIILERHPKDCGIICVTKIESMEKIVMMLKERGMNAVAFHGQLTAKERQKIVDMFNAGDVNWVCATKAGERGLDLKRGTCIFHMELPWTGASMTQRDRVTRRSGDLSKVTREYVILAEDSVELVVYDKIKARKEMDENLKSGELKNVYGMSWKKFLIEKWRRVYGVNLEEML